MDEINKKLRQVQLAFTDAPAFIRPHLLPVLQLLELLVLEIEKNEVKHGE